MLIVSLTEVAVLTFLRTLLARKCFVFINYVSVCLMGKGVRDRIKEEELKKKDQEIAELSASLSEGEPEGAKMPFFLPRKHSVKNYYEDSDFCVCIKHFIGEFAWETEERTDHRAYKTEDDP